MPSEKLYQARKNKCLTVSCFVLPWSSLIVSYLCLRSFDDMRITVVHTCNYSSFSQSIPCHCVS